MPVMTKSPKGDEIVILSREEYDRLIEAGEDREDAQMARRAIAQGFLSEIESGQKPGTPATLKKIAQALNIKIDDLIS